jgi:hypothetical protein
MKKYKFHTALSNIKNDCISWNKEYLLFFRQEIYSRRDQALSLKETASLILSIFIFPNFENKKKIFFFQGLRHSEYFNNFEKNTVVIIGSKAEKKFAVEHGFHFISSFSIAASVKALVYRDSSFVLKIIFSRWINYLKKIESSVFLIYEDTQPVGTFLNYLSQTCSDNSHAICIQHAFYAKPNYPVRLEGRKTEFNFIINESQGELIQPNFVKTSIIGLPYSISAKKGEIRSVILVGVGGVFYDNKVFRDSIDCFKKIYSIISQNFDLEIIYRPHPNELQFPEVIQELSDNFKIIDTMDIVDRLNDSRSIFIGVASSVLFQAEIAGHPVACFHADHRQEAILSDSSKILQMPNFYDLQEWIEDLRQNSTLKETNDDSLQEDPLKIFDQAMSEFYAAIK